MRARSWRRQPRFTGLRRFSTTPWRRVPGASHAKISGAPNTLRVSGFPQYNGEQSWGKLAAHEQRSRHRAADTSFPSCRPPAGMTNLAPSPSNTCSPTAGSWPAVTSRSATPASEPITCCGTDATRPSPWSKPRPSTRRRATVFSRPKTTPRSLGLKFAYATNGTGIVAYLDGLQAKVDALKQLQAESAAELDALLPSVLDRAFKGEL